MAKCVCFGCKSGYKSNQEQDKFNKIQFFKVPNDPNVIKEWQIAILRGDIKLKLGDVVCTLHFNSEDIIRVRTFFSCMHRNGHFVCLKRGKKTPFLGYTRKMRELSIIPMRIINYSRLWRNNCVICLSTVIFLLFFAPSR